MKVLKLFSVAVFAAILLASLYRPARVSGQAPTEAPAAFDDQTNGFEPQPDFDNDKIAFEAREEKADGLGPVYNAQACSECHQNPVTGGISQVFELRAGHNGIDGNFVPAPGGSLIQARAVNAVIQERVPDGPRIVFINSQGFVSVMGFDGGQYGPVGNTPVNGHFSSFAPDGARIAFATSSPTGNIWVMNNDGTNKTQLTTTGQDFMPAWSPDGTKIAFTSLRTGLAQVFLMNADGTGQVNISGSALNDGMPAWSPDGTKIAFVRSPTISNPIGRIWTMNANGSGQTQITFGPGNDERPSYSPDNSTIAFSTNRDGNYEIYKIPAIGGLATRLTNNAASDRNPAWAPDDSAIAFASDRGPTKLIWAIAPDGSNPTQLSPAGDVDDEPSYSRDQGETVRTFRTSLNILGDGFVEATDDSTFMSIRSLQPPLMRGTLLPVGVLEAPGMNRLGRFGWKNSVSSLISFSALAYQGEMGITSPLQPNESTSLGRNVTPFDFNLTDPEDTGGVFGFGEDVEAFARFMRSTKAPPRDTALVPNDAADPGSALFDSLSCNVCHTRSITTAPEGTSYNNGTFVVNAALANKTYHPFGDFMLHDIGTGDGIVETFEPTKNMVRTAPLWGVRTRDRLMHDGGSSSAPSNSGAQSFALNEAILRHAGQATISRTGYQALTQIQKTQLIRFLKSL